MPAAAAAKADKPADKCTGNQLTRRMTPSKQEGKRKKRKDDERYESRGPGGEEKVEKDGPWTEVREGE